MRVVADTNTVVSAFLWGGPPRAILDAAREGRITLHTTQPLLAELEAVLSREKFAARIRRVGSAVPEILAGYRALVVMDLPGSLPPTARDPDDDQVLAAALGAGAHLIVTRDLDLLSLRSFRDIPILVAHEALALIAEASG